MKVLLINGSPHENGCTRAALEEIQKTMQKEGVEGSVFWVGNKPLQPCVDCRRCTALGICTFQDRVNECLEIAPQYDGFVFGSPVHFAGPSGQISTFLDRLFFTCLNSGNEVFRLKPAAAVVVARRGGCSAAFDRLNKYMGIMQMPIVTSRYWNMVHGMTPEELREDEEGMRTIRILARNMAFLLKCREAGEKHGITVPQLETGMTTNFVRQSQ